MNYAKNYTLILSSTILVTGSFGAGVASAQTTISTDPFARQLDERPVEIYDNIDKIEPFSGNLSIRQTDVVLHNNGKFDLSLVRSYSPSRVFFGPKWLQGVGYSGKHIGMGWGWSLNLAPKLTVTGENVDGVRALGVEQYDPACGGASPPAYASYELELVDGRKENFFTDTTGIRRSPSNWRLSCAAGTYSVTSPDGVKYDFGARTPLIVFYANIDNPAYTDENRPAQQVLLNATKITDKAGNWYAISYSLYSNPGIYKYEKNKIIFTAKLPARVTSSDGQALDLRYDAPIVGTSYNSPGRTARLSEVIRSDGAKWQYKYSNISSQIYNDMGTPTQVNPPSQIYSMLTEVVRPDGSSWKFEYYDHVPYDFNVDGPASLTISSERGASDKLRTITTPLGGSVSYEYDTSDAYAIYNRSHEGGDPEQVQQDGVFQALRVRKRTTSDGGEWDYRYTPGQNPNELDATVITGPEGTIQYKHIGVNYSNNSNTNQFGPMFVRGYGEEKQGVAWMVGLLIEKKINETIKETYAWTSRPYGAAATQNIFYGRIGLVDSPAVLPALSSKSITLDGATYSTTYSNYDIYGNAGTIVESGPGGGSRTTTRNFYTDTAKWVIGRPKDESYPGSSITRTYNSSGNLASVNRDGVTTSYTYDSAGNLASTVYPRSLTHSYSNFRRGIAQTTSMPEQVTITREIDDFGNVLSEINGEAKKTSYTYDALGRVISITFPTGNKKTITYGQGTQTATRGELTETINQDGFGRIQSISLGDIVTRYEHDALGHQVFVSNPGDTLGTSYDFDGLGRIVAQRNSDGTSKTISYGAGSRTERDENGKTSVYAFKAYGDPNQQFLVSITTPVAAANTTIARNSKDLVTSVTQGSVTRTYGYDSRYYLTSITQPETGTITYGRDIAGNMTSRVLGGATTTYGYDSLNRLTSVTYPGSTPSVTQTYSKTNKLKTVTSSAATRNYSYDSNDNLLNEQVTVDGYSFAIGYGYNANDQLSSLTYPQSGKSINFAPDVLGRPAKVGSYVNSVTYWPSGQIRSMAYANGTTSAFDQNARMWPSGFSVSKGTTAYLRTSYGYDGQGNLKSIMDSVDAGLNRTMTYDGIDRLSTIAGPWGSGTITYDGMGNITQQVFGANSAIYRYDTSNRLTGISGNQNISITYDAYGDIATARGNAYTYDGVPNLRCINCTSTAKVEFVYDGTNRRISVLKSGVKTYEIYSSQGNLLAEFSPSTNKLIEYYYLGGKRVAQRVSQ